MRNLALLALSFIIIPVSLTQKKGVIKYRVTAEQQDTSYQSVMSTALLKKSEFTFIFKRKSKARVELKAGTFFDFTTIFDYKKGKYLRLISDYKNKTAAPGDIFIMPDSLINSKSTYTLLEDTMTILGFNCKKATFESKYGLLTCWYTTELDYNFRKLEFIDIDVPGLPLFFMTTSGKVTMSFQAVEFVKLKREYKKLLKLEIPEGYVTGPEPKLPQNK